MTHPESTLIVLIDAEDVKSVFAAWPDDICLAACLDRDGDCSMVVFRRAERPTFPDRLIEMLGKDAQEVCFVPRVPGFATRPFLYSDERRLMALVASDPSVLEEATDYALNVTYALEEGLDPAMVLGLPSRAVEVSKRMREPEPEQRGKVVEKTTVEKPAVLEPPKEIPQLAPGQLSPLLPDFLRRSAELSRRPRFSTVRTAKIGNLVAQH